ncbi:TatD family hydrolase [soil metagenome]
MMFIDTHTHLYLDDFKNDIDHIIDKAISEGVTKFYLPAIDSTVTDSLLSIENKYPGICFAMAGLHPCSVKENFEEELQHVQSLLKQRKFVAIGEIGIDLYWDKTFLKQQTEVFEIQMQLALDHSIPIVIHSRNAMGECIDAVKPFSDKGLKGIFHCFSGTEKEATKIIDMNFLLGIGGVLTYKNSGLADALKNININFMVLETDAPYLTPVPFRGKRNESSYIKIIAQKLSEIKKISLDEVARITTGNAQLIFG